MIIYRVKAGDTLASVARAHSILPTLLADANAIREGDPLVPGQALVITIPAATYHVREGDTVASVARRHGMRRHRLWQLNPAISGSEALYPGMTLAISPAEPPRSSVSVLGYAAAATPPEEILPTLPYLTFLAIDGGGLCEDGLPDLTKSRELALAARRAGTVPLLVLSAVGSDGAAGEKSRTERLLSDPTRCRGLVQELCPRLTEVGYGGVLLDLPFVPEDRRDAYLSLVMQLRRRLGHSGSLITSVAPPHRAADERDTAHLSSLGRASGALSLETYDFATRYGEPAPPAPYDRVCAAAEAACRAVRPQKLFLGISTRAQDTAVGRSRGRVLPARDALTLADADTVVSYDPVARAPYLSYRGEDGRHILFFEDAESFSEKLSLVERLGLGGITLYPSVSLPASLLSLLATTFRIVKAHES